MTIKDLNDKTICILGFGKEGHATLAAIEKHAPKAKVTIADKDAKVDTKKIDAQLGDDWLNNLDRFDVVIKSPGIPPSELPELSNITNATQIFLDSVKPLGAMVIGVTGSKGKSTTSSLIAAILKAGEKDVHLVGNIGKPALDYIDTATKDTIFVMEMSSYQLMNLETSPNIAVITSFFPEHLDYHGSEDAYKDAKKHITKFQIKGDTVFYNQFSPATKEIAKASKGKKVKFSWQEAPLRIEETKLIGHHNLSNISAAFAVSKFLKIPKPIAQEAIRDFEGLPHRLQMLGTHHGIDWVDDAISTTPESAIAALEALGDRINTIILGGQDRGNDFTELGRKVAASKVENVILFPGSGPRIKESITTASASVRFFEAASMEEAVNIAKEKTVKGNLCLLSTASPSYNMFKNFEEKGAVFQRCIGL